MNSFDNLIKNSMADKQVIGHVLSKLAADRRTLLFAELLMHVKVHKSQEIETAGVGIHGGIPHLFVNEEWFKTLKIKEQLFVLAHEASHLLYVHIDRISGKRANPEKWNIVTDAIINEALKHPDFEHVLDVLKESIFFDTIAPLYPPDYEFEDKSSEQLYKDMMDIGGRGKSKGNGGNNGKESTKDIENRIKEVAKKNWDEHLPMDGDSLKPEIKETMDKMIKNSKKYGEGSRALIRKLLDIRKKSFPFVHLLKKELERRRLDFSRQHRRLKRNPFLFPRKLNEKFEIYAAVDVSGSCYEYTEDFLSYIVGLPEFRECYFFDTEIVAVWTDKKEIPQQMAAYGGTDLNPVMEKFIEIEKTNPHTNINFIILTDGQIPPLHVGPKRGNVLVLTTDAEVHSPNINNIFKNIKIIPEGHYLDD